MFHSYSARFDPRRLAWVLLFTAVMVSCSAAGAVSPPVESHGGPVTDLVSLTDTLRQAGISVQPVGAVSRPFLSVSGTESRANSGTIEIYEFSDKAAAGVDAGQFNADATLPGETISWQRQAHLYRSGRLIVLYDGDDAILLRILETALGPPFAAEATVRQ